MKKAIIFVTMFLTSFCITTEVYAGSWIEPIKRVNNTLVYTYKFNNNNYIFPTTTESLAYGVPVKKVRVAVNADAGANYQVKLLANAGGGMEVNIQVSSTGTGLDKSKARIIEFIPQTGTCSQDTSVCVTVSPEKLNTSTTYLAKNANQSAIQFVKNGLFGTLAATAKVTYYF